MAVMVGSWEVSPGKDMIHMGDISASNVRVSARFLVLKFIVGFRTGPRLGNGEIT